MKKFLIISFIISLTVFFGSVKMVQAKDLCGGTSGNGRILSVENNSFTVERGDGRKLIVSLTSHATIETSSGFISLSDLKIGDRVTLVGGDNRDGSFTADAVVVCSGTQENTLGSTSSPQARQSAPFSTRNYSPDYEKVSGEINATIILLVSLIWLGTSLFLKLKKRKSFVYLLFFTIFYIYLYKVLDYTLLQFQSLLLLQHFLPNLMLNGVDAGRTVNLIPLATLTLEDVKTTLLNILMMIPFGFGLPFITNFRFKRTVLAGLLLSIAIELLQLITGFSANTTFRVADINDLIFNTIGVAIGYILFVAFVRAYRRIFRNGHILTNPLLQYIADRPQIDKQQ